MKNTNSVLKQLIKEELEGLGPRKGAMSGLPGSTASQRRYSRRAGELEADRMTHGMDINPYQALADQAIAEIEGSVVNRGMARPALDKLIQAAESDPDAKAVLDAVQSETGLSIGRMSAVATMPRMTPQLSPAERDAATMQENYKPILGGSKMKITKSALKQLIKEELANLEEQELMTDPEGGQTRMAADQVAAIAAQRGLNNVAGDLQSLAGAVRKAVASQDNQAVINLAQRVRSAAMDLYNIVMAAKSEASGASTALQQKRGQVGGRGVATSDIQYDSGGRPI